MMSRETYPQQTGMNALPDDGLAHVLTFLRPKLDVMLVCKRWCRVTLEGCSAWWRSVHVLGGAYKQVEGSGAPEAQPDEQPSGREAVLHSKPAVLTGFGRVAPHFHRLHVTSASDVILPVVPELLSLAADRSPQLECLELAGAMADGQACKAALEAIGAMAELKSLAVQPESCPPLMPRFQPAAWQPCQP